VPELNPLPPLKQSSAPPGNRRGESDDTSLTHQPSVVGANEGEAVGSTDGSAVGSTDGFCVGFTLGFLDGALVGADVGSSVGTNDGTKDGSFVGNRVGIAEGANVSTQVEKKKLLLTLKKLRRKRVKWLNKPPDNLKTEKSSLPFVFAFKYFRF